MNGKIKDMEADAALRDSEELYRALLIKHKKTEQEMRSLWQALDQAPANVVITNIAGNIE